MPIDYRSWFAEHAVQGAVNELVAAVASDHEGVNLGRTRLVAAQVDALRRAVEPELLTEDVVDEVSEAAQALTEAIVGLEAEPPEDFDETLDHLGDSLVAAVAGWRIAVPISDAVARTAIDVLAGEAAAVAEKYKKRSDELDEVLSRNQQQAEAIGVELNERVAELQAARTEEMTSLRSEVDSLQSGIDAQKARLDQAIADFQSQFSQAQDTRLQQFSAHVEDWKTKAADEAEALEAAGQELIEDLKRLKADALKVTEAIGVAGMAEGFNVSAAGQKKNADLLRIAAIVLLLLTAGVALAGLVTSSADGRLDAPEFLAKLALSIPFGGAAAYCVSQSAHHRERERHNKQVAMELASITPYLSLMPEADQLEIKKTLALRWFGQQLEPIEATNGSASVMPYTEVVKLLGDLVKKA